MKIVKNSIAGKKAICHPNRKMHHSNGKCSTCYAKDFKGKWPSKTSEYARNFMFKWRYNITPEDFKRKLAKQNNMCAICNIVFLDEKRDIHIDHDHNSNKVRGMLCMNCNIGIGHFKDDINLLKLAIKYLNKYK